MGNLCTKASAHAAAPVSPRLGDAADANAVHREDGALQPKLLTSKQEVHDEDEDFSAQTRFLGRGRACPAAAWLKELGLSQYAAAFQAAGYNDWELLGLLLEKDLQMIELHGNMIILPGHRKKLLLASKQMGQPRPVHPGRRRLRATKSFEVNIRTAAQLVRHPSRVTPLHSVCTPRSMSATSASCSSAALLSKDFLDPLPGGTSISRQSSTSTFKALSSMLRMPNTAMSALKSNLQISSTHTSPTPSLADREHANTLLGAAYLGPPHHNTSRLTNAGDASPRAVPSVSIWRPDVFRAMSHSPTVSMGGNSPSDSGSFSTASGRHKGELGTLSKRQLYHNLSQSIGSQSSLAAQPLLTPHTASSSTKHAGDTQADGTRSRPQQCLTDGGVGPGGPDLRPAHSAQPLSHNRFLLRAVSLPNKRASGAEVRSGSKTPSSIGDPNRPANSQGSRLRHVDSECASGISSQVHSDRLPDISNHAWTTGREPAAERPEQRSPATGHVMPSRDQHTPVAVDPVCASPTWAVHRSQQVQHATAQPPPTTDSPKRFLAGLDGAAPFSRRGTAVETAPTETDPQPFALVSLSAGVAPAPHLLSRPPRPPATSAPTSTHASGEHAQFAAKRPSGRLTPDMPQMVLSGCAAVHSSSARPFSAPVRHIATDAASTAHPQGRAPQLYALSYGHEATHEREQQLPGSCGVEPAVQRTETVGRSGETDGDERELRRANLQLVKALMQRLGSSSDAGGQLTDGAAPAQEPELVVQGAHAAQQRKALLVHLKTVLSQLVDISSARGAVTEKPQSKPSAADAALPGACSAVVSLNAQWLQLHQLHQELNAKVDPAGVAGLPAANPEPSLCHVVSTFEQARDSLAPSPPGAQTQPQSSHQARASRPAAGMPDPLTALAQVEAAVKLQLAQLAKLMGEDAAGPSQPSSSELPAASGHVSTRQPPETDSISLQAAVSVVHSRKRAQQKKNRLSACMEEGDARAGVMAGHVGDVMPCDARSQMVNAGGRQDGVGLPNRLPGREDIHEQLQALEQRIKDKINSNRQG